MNRLQGAIESPIVLVHMSSSRFTAFYIPSIIQLSGTVYPSVAKSDEGTYHGVGISDTGTNLGQNALRSVATQAYFRAEITGSIIHTE